MTTKHAGDEGDVSAAVRLARRFVEEWTDPEILRLRRRLDSMRSQLRFVRGRGRVWKNIAFFLAVGLASLVVALLLREVT